MTSIAGAASNTWCCSCYFVRSGLVKCWSLGTALFVAWTTGLTPAGAQDQATPLERRLYVAVPGIRNYLEYGGHGLLVYDIDHGHRLIKRIPTGGLDAKGHAQQRQGDLRERPDRAGLHQHARAAHVSRSCQREGALGEALRRGLRPDVDHA